MNPKIIAILCDKRDDYKTQRLQIEKEQAADLEDIKAKNYKIRINRLQRMEDDVQALITVEMQAALDEHNKIKREYPDWQTPTDMLEKIK